MNPLDSITNNTIITAGSAERPWSSIIVPTEVKERLLNQTLLAFTLRRSLPFSITALHGLVLLFGPPGTGKTTLARGLPIELTAAMPKIRLIEVNPHGLMSAEHGQSQQHVARLLEEAIPEFADDGLPTLVLIDEVESMAVARSEASLAANPVDVHRATDAVLTALDRSTETHPNIVWIATSNFTDALDGAFRSRADAAIEVPLPGPAGVERILRTTLSSYAEHFPDLKRLADSPAVAKMASIAGDLDGRQARKLVAEALAGRREVAVNPNVLTVEDLKQAVSRLEVT